MTTRTRIEVDHFYPHPLAEVWLALTDRELLSQWLMPTQEFRAELGVTFTLDAGRYGLTRGEVLEVEPERRLRISWVHGDLDTTVTWVLEAEGRGTRLFVPTTASTPTTRFNGLPSTAWPAGGAASWRPRWASARGRRSGRRGSGAETRALIGVTATPKPMRRRRRGAAGACERRRGMCSLTYFICATIDGFVAASDGGTDGLPVLRSSWSSSAGSGPSC